MRWLKWTEAQLLSLAAAQLTREDLLLELKELEENYGLRSPSIDGMPRAKGFISSVVESTALHRHDVIERVKWELKEHDDKIERILAAMASLRPIERAVLEIAYLRLDLVYESNIARIFNLSLDDFIRLKVHALAKLYEHLTGSWPQPVDIEALVAEEVAKEEEDERKDGAVWKEWIEFLEHARMREHVREHV